VNPRVAVAVAVVAAGCGDRKESTGGGAYAPWVHACEAAITAAASAPSRERAGVILAGCATCGPPWAPVAAAERGEVRPADVLAVIDACGGTCKGTARSSLADALAEAARGDAPSLPWRQLARECPATLGVDDVTARHASATWYALGRVASGITAAAQGGKAPASLPAAATGLVFPLPPRSIAGTGLRVADAQHVDPRLARLHVTATATESTVGALPLARLGKTGVELVPGPGLPYPGEPIALDKVPERLDAIAHELAPGVGDLDGAVLIAPVGLPASRALEVLRAMAERRIYLGAVPAQKPAGGWVDVVAGLAPPFGGKAPGRALVIRLGQGGAIGVSGGWGGLAVATQLPAGPTPHTQRAAEAVARLATKNEVVAIDATADVTVEDLTRLVDGLAGAGVTAVVAAPALRWPKLGAFDEAALRAAHVPQSTTP
jgi:hypothetical protein